MYLINIVGAQVCRHFKNTFHGIF